MLIPFVSRQVDQRRSKQPLCALQTIFMAFIAVEGLAICDDVKLSRYVIGANGRNAAGSREAIKRHFHVTSVHDLLRDIGHAGTVLYLFRPTHRPCQAR